MAYKNTDILDDIRHLGDQVGGTPTLQQYREQGSYSASLVYDRFGSWRDAVDAAGFEPHDPQQKIPRDDLIEELERLDDEVDGRPMIDDMNEKGEYSASSYRVRFGSWAHALQSIGIEITPREHTDTTRDTTTDASKQDLVAEIQRIAEECGAPSTTQDMRGEGKYSVSRFREQFDTWTAAVEEAGFEPNRTHRLTEDQLIQELHRLRDKLGRRPNSPDVAEQGKHGVATYQRHFGSWSTALEVAFSDRSE